MFGCPVSIQPEQYISLTSDKYPGQNQTGTF